MRFLLIVVGSIFVGLCQAKPVSSLAQQTAAFAVEQYHQPVIESLAKMVSFKTVADEAIAYDKNPAFIGFKAYIAQLSQSLGLQYQDRGYVMIVSIGESDQRLGIITHGDVQPADPAKWHKSPFELNRESIPGVLIGRGTEDDKSPIATALYAMKAVKDQGIKLSRKIELIIYMAEESDWGPFREFLKTYQPPQMNVTIDAEYPVVVAEKGWAEISVEMPVVKHQHKGPYIAEFSGGSFKSQIPEDAKVVINNISAGLIAHLKAKSLTHKLIQFAFTHTGSTLTIIAKGKSAHSSTPEDGINAVAYLADILAGIRWPKSSAGLAVAYLNDLVGTGFYGEKFGRIAYEDKFMGRMTVLPTLVKQTETSVSVSLNVRRPVGKEERALRYEVEQALTAWQRNVAEPLQNVNIELGSPPLLVKDAPHVQPLLDIFSHFSGIKDAQPIAIGGSTNAKLMPNAVSFGPSMPGVMYTGHSEHEFITEKQLRLNLQMYTAMMVTLGMTE